MEACTPSREAETEAIAALRAQEIAALATDPRASVFDPLPIPCDARRCPIERDGRLGYRDSSHLTASFARHLAPELSAFVRGAVGRAPSPVEARALARPTPVPGSTAAPLVR